MPDVMYDDMRGQNMEVGRKHSRFLPTRLIKKRYSFHTSALNLVLAGE